ncbi:MAG: ribosomal protein [Acidimicrobiaceae bacterium]|nr:ribosomal protein [Acidimicrobiaceae bacterium]
MAVKLRLMRMGKKKQPTYRIVAADSHSPRDGRFIEIVGTYAPRSEPSKVDVDNAKAVAWLAKGAQPTETVRKLLVISGAWGEYSDTRTAKPVKVRERPSRTAGKAPGGKAPAKASKATAKADVAATADADAPAAAE